jgi:hypothetical protein
MKDNLRQSEGGSPIEEIEICQLRSSSRYSIDIVIGSQQVEAVVDTSRCHLISNELYNTLQPKPKTLLMVRLLTAGGNLGPMSHCI